jgi:branched-chain amino acid transport system permease protein
VDSYLVSMAVFAGIYALMSLGMNVVWGMAGMLNLGLAGFFAQGAYVSALLTVKAGLPIASGLACGAAVSALVGVVVALVTARLRADYLAIVTLGFSETVRLVASNEIWLTNGTDGISGIPGPYRALLAPRQFGWLYLAVVAGAIGLAYLLLQRLGHAPFGRVLRAIRDDDQVAAVAGKPVMAFKVKAFALSAGILGLAGGLYGHYTSYVAPEMFSPLLTLYVVLALLAGGIGNNRGAVAGAVLVVFFLESTRFVIPLLPGLTPVRGAAIRELLVSGSLLVVLRLRPAGLIPERLPRIPVPATAAGAPAAVEGRLRP